MSTFTKTSQTKQYVDLLICLAYYGEPTSTSCGQDYIIYDVTREKAITGFLQDFLVFNITDKQSYDALTSSSPTVTQIKLLDDIQLSLYNSV